VNFPFSMTHPENPNHRNQRYCLTDLGRSLLEYFWGYYGAFWKSGIYEVRMIDKVLLDGFTAQASPIYEKK